ncbi:shikimate kinase AroK [Francisella noatunensis]|uniref:Shikimate kinase n=1 Tax=Francisella noatunensis TaxID=657445 RepID=A0A9Q2KR12_9GAMM|nr:shikimate kinase AroK [Francisella noatunensis]MBK2029015.1 shikimate kinase AroK [Francisella noatunensis]MBK2034441.1 shikimate kinase AroK [Francisella noatunensis]MBK2049134.1 shikimate kinase AroK [Francisella noatunensis]MBK2050491.1 shikimate kinase AroK [Francisella noatunensis]MBK2051942.1 shikimate kinase AroK [Francisella noatunensis]
MIRTKNIFLIGPVGAGKSTIGKQLAKQLKLEFIDSDDTIEKKCGVDINWIFDLEGEEGFRKRERDVIAEILAEKQNIVLATGGGAILDPDTRSLLSSRGKVVYLGATIEQQLERTAKDTKRPLLRVDDKKPVLEQLMAEREPLYRSIADVVVETNGATVKNIVNKISTFLVEETIL